MRVRVTNCTVHGGWTDWSAWSACSQTCGSAMKIRRRTCTNPTPAFGGRICVGHDHDDIICIALPPCPVPAKVTPPQIGQWSTWGPWHACSKPCNGGEYYLYNYDNFPVNVKGMFEKYLSQSRICNFRCLYCLR